MKSVMYNNYFLDHSIWDEAEAHTDKNGMWGGRLAAIVHFRKDPSDIDGMKVYNSGVEEVYLHLGGYYEIGRFQADYKIDKSPTRFQTGKLIMDCVRTSEHLSLLYFLLRIVVWIERLFR